jgi:phenylacetic acid degradation operon negative regulatory protein
MQPALQPILDHLRREPSRTWSIVITVYGDAIVPRGGSLWLGTLCELFAAMGINDGVVRTAASRLAADGWLVRERVGRNSYYRLGPEAEATFATAAARIYGRHVKPAQAGFRLVVLNAGAEREGARLALQLAGFGAAAPGLFVAPADAAVPPEAADAISMTAAADADTTRRLAAQAWKLDSIAAQYGQFLRIFAPLLPMAEAGVDDLDAILIRILLIHEYRRIVLRDPLLPAPMLAEDWPGGAAHDVCARLYGLLVPGSERWLDSHALNRDGKLPPADLRERFA